MTRNLFNPKVGRVNDILSQSVRDTLHVITLVLFNIVFNDVLMLLFLYVSNTVRFCGLVNTLNIGKYIITYIAV